LITKALAQRPDLVAKLANVRSKEYEIRRTRAEYYPKVTLDTHFTETDLQVSVAKSDYFGGTRPTFGAFLTMNVPIFDGFARRHKLDMAEADLRQAENELAGARDSAARDVWKAYTDYRTALKKQDAAEKLLAASTSAFDAVLESYKQGLSTYTEVVTAERNLTSARATSHDTWSAIYTSQAALALSVGDLARPAPPLVRQATKMKTEFPRVIPNFPPARRSRTRHVALAGIVLLIWVLIFVVRPVSHRSPTIDILGSYFPAWMICIVSGLTLTLISRWIIRAYRLEPYASPAPLIYTCLTIIYTFLTWIIFYQN
jgi:Outer membrane protein